MARYMLRLCVMMILETFCCGVYGSATGNVRLTQQSPQQSICPGDEIVYLCTVPGNAVIWGTPVGDFVVLQTFEPPPVGGYVARFVQYDDNCLTSNLTFFAVNQTTITCENSARTLQNSTAIDAEGPPSAPHLFPLTEGDIMQTGFDNIRRVSLNWTEPVLFSTRISRYILTVSPPPSPCASGQCFTGAGERGTQLTLNTGQRYNFIVRADNCGDAQMGTESEQLTVLLQIPPPPDNCTSTPLYNQSSNSLTAIETTWTAVNASADSTFPDQQYEITFQRGTGGNHSVPLSCSGQQCSYHYSVNEAASSTYRVSIKATNVVGLSPSSDCSTQRIASTNNLLDIMLISTNPSTNTQLQCTFLSGMTGSAVCAVFYGTDPTYMNLMYFAESSETGIAGESVNVVLREQLISSSTYYYNATAVTSDTTVIVQGSFTTPQYNCPLSQLWTPDHFDIISSTVSRNSRCPSSSVGSFTLRDNRTSVVTVVCYDGTAPGSAAVIVCDQSNGCAPNTTGSGRVCQTDTTWSGQSAICYCTSAPSQDLQAWQIALIVAIPVLCVIIILISVLCVVLYHCKGHIGAVFQSIGKTKDKTDHSVKVKSTSKGPSKKNIRENNIYARPSPLLFRRISLVEDPGFPNVNKFQIPRRSNDTTQ